MTQRQDRNKRPVDALSRHSHFASSFRNGHVGDFLKGEKPLQQLAENFWNFRGSFKIAKILDVGTQMSLVRCANGRFLVLDSYSVDDDDRENLLALTDGGKAIDAIINVHPFHTLHCRAMHDLAPPARLIGTRRHRVAAAELPWEDGVIEDPRTQADFVKELDFSLPGGVDLVTDDDSVHAGSVLVRHRDSGIVHVDDTLNVLAAPGILGRILPQSQLKFHQALPKALEKRPGAADAFVRWAQKIAQDWTHTSIVCAAHSAVRRLSREGWQKELLEALSGVRKTLDKHRAEFG